MPSDVPAAIRHLPADVQRLIEKECRGNWKRVTRDSTGAFTVHNRAQRDGLSLVGPPVKKVAKTTATKKVAAKKAVPMPPSPAPVTPVPAPGAALGADGRLLPEEFDTREMRALLRAGIDSGFLLVEEVRATLDEAGVPVTRWPALNRVLDACGITVLNSVPKQPPTPELPSGLPNAKRTGFAKSAKPGPAKPGPAKPGPPRSDAAAPVAKDGDASRLVLFPGIDTPEDWSIGDFEGRTWVAYQRVRYGIPKEAPIAFHAEVASLYSVDLDTVEAVCRNPDRCEIDASSVSRKYPVLKYGRGDVLVVVGFREPNLPLIIGAYVEGLSLADHHRRSTASGGGGRRKPTGLPTRPPLVVERLRSLGAEIDQDEIDRQKTAEVKFHGQSCGKINVSNTYTRIGCEGDYQRAVRRIQAIRNREENKQRA